MVSSKKNNLIIWRKKPQLKKNKQSAWSSDNWIKSQLSKVRESKTRNALNRNEKIIFDLINKKLKKILNKNKKINISKIDFFPISFNFNVNFTKKNILVLGEGSYNVHPVAGQGFNLVLRDIQELYNEFAKLISLGIQIKDSEIFHKFKISRKPENLLFGLGINFIHNFFKDGKVPKPLKKIILKDINRFKFLKDLNLRIADSGIFK